MSNYYTCLQKLALILFKSAKEGGYTNPTKVEQILGVSAEETSVYSQMGVSVPALSAHSETSLSVLDTSARSGESGKGKFKSYSSKLA